MAQPHQTGDSFQPSSRLTRIVHSYMFSKKFPSKNLGMRVVPGCLKISQNHGFFMVIYHSTVRKQITFNKFGVSKSQMKLKLLHPGRLTWNLQITHLERKMIFQTSMIMFHVNLQGCTKRLWGYGSVYWTMSPKNWNRYLAGYPRRWNVGWQTVFSKQKQCQKTL